MGSPVKFDPAGDEPSLSFYCGDVPTEVEVRISENGIEPNGYFWEGVLGFLQPELSAALEFDSEADMFAVYGDGGKLKRARGLLEPYLADPSLVAQLIDRANASGFDLQNREPGEVSESPTDGKAGVRHADSGMHIDLPEGDPSNWFIGDKRRVAIYRLPPEHRSLSFLAPDIAHIEELRIYDPKCRDISVLEGAVSLKTLEIDELKPVGSFDATQLTSLRSLQAKSSPTNVSLLSIPSLETLWLSNARQGDLAAISGRLRSLGLRRVVATDLPATVDLSMLTNLQVIGAGDFDVSVLADAPRLKNVRYQNVKVVRGIGAMRGTRELAQVDFISCDTVADFNGFETLPGWRVQVLGLNPFPPEFMRDLSSQQRTLWI